MQGIVTDDIEVIVEDLDRQTDETTRHSVEYASPIYDTTKSTAGNGWNDEGESILRTWSDECLTIAVRHLRISRVCKYIYISLILPSMILSYVFGTTGLTTTTNEYATIQGYVLLAVGLLSTILKFGKFEKRAESYKHSGNNYKMFARKLKVQLACSRENRKPYESYMEKIERDYRKLMKNK